MFRVKSRVWATKEERQPSRTVVPLWWWHHIKPLSTSIPLSRWAVLVKTTAMTGILLVGATGKHHKIIKSKVTLCPHYMSTRLWNKNPPVWCQRECQGLTLAGWHGDGEAVNAVGLGGSNRYGYSNKMERGSFLQPWRKWEDLLGWILWYLIYAHVHKIFSPHYHAVEVGRAAALF